VPKRPTTARLRIPPHAYRFKPALRAKLARFPNNHHHPSQRVVDATGQAHGGYVESSGRSIIVEPRGQTKETEEKGPINRKELKSKLLI